MGYMEVLIHVKGDRESVIEYLKKNQIEYKSIRNQIWVKNCWIYLGSYGKPENRLCFYSEMAKKHEGKPIFQNLGWGEIYKPFNEQLEIYKQLKNAILVNRKKFYENTVKEMQEKKEKRDTELKIMHQVIDFENNVLREEHQLEEQIRKTINFIADLKKDFPKATFNHREYKYVDQGLLTRHIYLLNDILLYLKDEELETVHILKDIESPIQIEKTGKKVKIQKKHLKKLSSKLNKFVKELKYFLRTWIKSLEITTEMRAHLKNFYTNILRLYEWYSNLFKIEAQKKIIKP